MKFGERDGGDVCNNLFLFCDATKASFQGVVQPIRTVFLFFYQPVIFYFFAKHTINGFQLQNSEKHYSLKCLS